jgi:hypothetical protein
MKKMGDMKKALKSYPKRFAIRGNWKFDKDMMMEKYDDMIKSNTKIMSKSKHFFLSKLWPICQMAGTMQFLQRWNTIAEEIIKNKKNSLE